MAYVPLEKMAIKVLYTKIELQREYIDRLLDRLFLAELYSKEYHDIRRNFWNHWRRLEKVWRIYKNK